jgi:adenine phosphoribosyltransferase
MTDIKNFIRDIPDFPKPGIIFKDITPLLKEPAAFSEAIDQLIAKVGDTNCDAVVGIESRGFIFGAAMAIKMGIPFVPVRKPGKLPYETISATYELEYGTDSIEIHTDALEKGQRVILVDDLLATGGTMAACCNLVKGLGVEILGCLFVIELGFLNGRAKLKDQEIHALISY